MLNQTISGYTILRLLGKGGMADVYYAENKLKRPAAIKILHASLSSQSEVKSRFESEAQITVSLDHPNIRKVFDVAEVDGRPAIIMEYLEGHTLSEALTNKLLDPSILPDLFNQAVTGLQYAHQHGIVHRDIKPSNLFLTKVGQLKILDFGIAKVEEASYHTLTGQTLGTILYMSPEQVEDPKRVDYRTDIYSLGVTFYHLVTGKIPYDLSSDSLYKIQSRIVNEALDFAALPLDWNLRLASCLSKNPENRILIPSIKSDSTISINSNQNIEHLTSKAFSNKRVRYLNYYILILVLILLFGGIYILKGKDFKRMLDQKRRHRDYASLQSKYDSVSPVFGDEPIAVKKWGKYGYVTQDGKEIIALKYDNAGDFSEGLAPVSVGGKWGFIDVNNNVVIPFMYEYAQKYSEGLAPVKKNGLYGFIDNSGQVIIDFKFEDAFPFNNGRARVMRTTQDVWFNGEYLGRGVYAVGYIDKKGAILIPIIYRLGWDFSNGKTEVTTFEGEVFELDTLGNAVKIGNVTD